MNWDAMLKPIISSVIFSVIGMAVFLAGFFVIQKMLPYDVHKEIEVDQNSALALIISACILGLAFIVGMAIHG